MSEHLPRYQDDPRLLRETFAHFPSGVVAVLATVENEPKGLVAAAFTVGVSLDPPLVSCAIQRGSTTWPALRTVETIGVSVLGENQSALCRQLGSADRHRRFEGLTLLDTGSTALFIDQAPVWFECKIHGEFPAGDHFVALLEVVGLGADPRIGPLVFHRSEFRQLQLAASER